MKETIVLHEVYLKLIRLWYGSSTAEVRLNLWDWLSVSGFGEFNRKKICFFYFELIPLWIGIWNGCKFTKKNKNKGSDEVSEPLF